MLIGGALAAVVLLVFFGSDTGPTDELLATFGLVGTAFLVAAYDFGTAFAKAPKRIADETLSPVRALIEGGEQIKVQLDSRTSSPLVWMTARDSWLQRCREVLTSGDAHYLVLFEKDEGLPPVPDPMTTPGAEGQRQEHRRMTENRLARLREIVQRTEAHLGRADQATRRWVLTKDLLSARAGEAAALMNEHAVPEVSAAWRERLSELCTAALAPEKAAWLFLDEDLPTGDDGAQMVYQDVGPMSGEDFCFFHQREKRLWQASTHLRPEEVQPDFEPDDPRWTSSR